ncbi:MAG: glycosyltransferase [Anaerolineae bacterium]
MKITIMAVGSRGDVQPVTALGAGLQQRGHQVRLVAGDEFERLVHAAGLDFVPLGVQMHHLVAQYKDFYQLMAAVRGNVMKTLGTNQDAYISTFMGVSACTVARALSVPYFYAALIPGLPTRAFAHPIFPPRPLLGGWYNLLTYRMADNLALRSFPDTSCLLREPRPMYLCGFSEQVVPRPPEWGEFAHITGYWFLDRPDYEPSPALRDFIESGPPPVVVGFGSAEGGSGRRTLDLVMEALQHTNQRGVFLTGWGSMLINDPPSNVFVTDAVPYDWLYPRAAAVVHHGGAGTMASALRAGVPSVVIPFGLDQTFWAGRVYQLGASAQPIARKNLTVERLSAAIRQAVENPHYRNAAEAIGIQIRTENGAARAADLIEKTVAEWGRAGSKTA